MEPLQPDRSYHIFNHANGFENIFRIEANFVYFLEKYRLYISPIAETYAYCLMPNHFHLVVRIRKRETLEAMIRINNNPSIRYNFSKVSSIAKNFSKVATFDEGMSKVSNFGKVINEESNFGKVIKISDDEIEKFLSKQFANLFSCYTQSFNRVYHRKGSLFIKNFKREPISDKIYFLNAIVYTHRNPIHHGFREKYEDWEYSSYNDIVGGVCDFIEISKLLTMTDGLESFKEMHRHSLDDFTTDCDL
jgi:REP element-mobilizing transposase RayT